MIPIYHITSLENLASILKRDELLSYNALHNSQILYKNIAYENIQYRRATTRVPCGYGGVLHDYVPFYFAPRSPMLYSLYRGNVPGYDRGQSPIIYLASRVEYAMGLADLSVVFSDGDPIMAYSEFFEDLYALNYAIDWELIWEVTDAKSWADTDEDGDRKRRRQAEFLVYQCFPWLLITEIGVISPEMKQRVETQLKQFPNRHQPPVNIYSNGYY
jgi:hypothetical protein